MVPKNILVPTDFSPCAEHALDYACSLAAALGAKVHVVNAIGTVFAELAVALTDQMVATMRHNNMQAVEKLVAPRRALAAFGTLAVLDGDARDAILAASATVHADLIVMGTHGRRGVRRALLGSIAEDVVRHAPCPVLTVRLERAS